MLKRLIFTIALISTFSFAFTFDGLKSGMTMEEVTETLLNRKTKLYCGQEKYIYNKFGFASNMPESTEDCITKIFEPYLFTSRKCKAIECTNYTNTTNIHTAQYKLTLFGIEMHVTLYFTNYDKELYKLTILPPYRVVLVQPSPAEKKWKNNRNEFISIILQNYKKKYGELTHAQFLESFGLSKNFVNNNFINFNSYNKKINDNTSIYINVSDDKSYFEINYIDEILLKKEDDVKKKKEQLEREEYKKMINESANKL